MISKRDARKLSPITEQTRHGPRQSFIANPKAPLRQQLREVMRFFHYSQRTEDTYWQWIVRYLRFHKRAGVSGSAAWQHPRDLGPQAVQAYLTHLAADRNVSASTQNQALHPVR